MKRRAVVALLLVLAACGNKQGYGGKSVDNLAKNVNDKLALGQVTTTTKVAATAPTGKQTIGSSGPATTARATVTTRAVPTLTIAIVKDSAGYFDPQGGSVYAGSNVVWVNHDTVPRSVEADNNAFRSPSLAPGQSYTWVATVVGTINYSDGTRPYAKGILQVVGR